MKPQAIRAQGMNRPETLRILQWLTANGLRHYIPENATIQIHGNHIIVDTFDIERVGTARRKKGQPKPWYVHKTDRLWHTEPFELPIKTRKYRIRHELKDIR